MTVGQGIGGLISDRIEQTRTTVVTADRAESVDRDLGSKQVGYLGPFVGRHLESKVVHLIAFQHRQNTQHPGTALRRAPVVERLCRVQLRRVEVEVLSLQLTVGVVQVDRLIHHRLIVDADERGRGVIRSGEFSLQISETLRYRNPCCLGLELHEHWHTQAVLLAANEEEQAVVQDWPSKRSAVLILRGIQFSVERVGGGQARAAIEAEYLTAKRIAARFGDHIHKSSRGPADLSTRAGEHDLEFFHRGLWEEENGLVATALISLQRVIEVCAVDGHV